ncbi:ABC transporter substrate binding protein [Nocardioides humi]|uniref:ABC transporter substrate-binding protein n=1 Tax=Nocardioides humi TaxID=449461 RepID=A0ABN2B4D0_9ACTN|nr:ABC transporter substrate binding protein [Nocardioides humi]
MKVHARIARSPRVVGAVAVTAAIALGLAACGSDGDGASGSGGSQTIKLGSISDLSGPASVIGIAGREGQETAVNVINGDPDTYLCSPDRKIELKYDDGTNAPTTAVTIAKNYISSREYLGIIGPLYTAQAQAMAPLTSKAKIPLLVPYTPGSKELTGLGDYVFASSQPDAQTAVTGVDALTKAWPDAQNVGVLYASDSAAHIPMSKLIMEELTKAGKTPIEFSVPFTSTDLSSAISTFKSKDVQAIYILLNSPAQVAAMQAASRSDYHPHWFGYSTMFTQAVIDGGGDEAEGALLASDYDPNLDNDLNKTFREAYKADFNKEPDSWAALGFQSVMTYAAAICSIDGEVTGDQLRDALQDVQAPAIVNGGTFTFNDDRLVAVPPNVLEIKDGKFVSWAG